MLLFQFVQKKSLKGYTSKTRAMTPAAIGALADVPVWVEVHLLCRSVVTIFLSPDEPELNSTKYT